MLISIRITKLYNICRGLYLISTECMHTFFIKLVFCMKINQKNRGLSSIEGKYKGKLIGSFRYLQFSYTQNLPTVSLKS